MVRKNKWDKYIPIWNFLQAGSQMITIKRMVNFDDEEDFLTDISGYFQHIKEELPSSSISKWEMGDKLVIKITNFIFLPLPY